MTVLTAAAARHGWPLRLRELTGWRRWAAAALLGAVAILALPPAYATPLLWLVFPGLLLLLNGAAGPRQAFAIGWWFGFAHHLLGLYWISFALLLDAARFFWLMPFAAAGLPAVLACFIGAGMAALDWASRRFRLSGIGRVLGFAVMWSVAEYLRGHVLTGFPWNLVAYGWTVWLPVFQTVSLVGSYGLGLLTAAIAALPYLLADAVLGRRRAWVWVASGLAVLVGATGWGVLRLDQPVGSVPGVTLRLVQPNIEQTLKWDPAARRSNFEKVLRLTLRPPDGAAPTVVLWPESAVPYDLEHDANAQEAVASVIPPGAVLLAGTARATLDPASGAERYWNSLLALDHQGQVLAIYDKFHLVPFGEYVPLRRWLPLPGSVTGGEFSAGPGPRVLVLPGLPPVSPLICYEIIFPARVKPVPSGPGAAAALDRHHHQRWLVRQDRRTASAFRHGPRPRGRRRAAGGARRQYRHFRRGRPLWQGARPARARHRRGAGCAAAGGGRDHPVWALGRSALCHAPAGRPDAHPVWPAAPGVERASSHSLQ